MPHIGEPITPTAAGRLAELADDIDQAQQHLDELLAERAQVMARQRRRGVTVRDLAEPSRISVARAAKILS